LKKIFTYKVNGTALVYAMLVFLIATLVITNVSLMDSFHRKSQIDLSRQHQVLRNVDSGLELLLANDIILDKGWNNIDLFGTTKDSVSLKKLKWGVFEIALSKAWNKKYHEQKGSLIAYKSDMKHALFLAEMNQPLSITGNTRIEGNVLLPKKGVKRAYIEGENYLGDKMIFGSIAHSERDLIMFDKQLFKDLFEQDFMEETDTIIPIDGIFQETIKQSFFKPTIVLESYGNLDLVGAHIQDNCKIFCDQNLFISASSKLTNTIIFAKQVYIEEGFKGSVQIFASDSVFIESDVDLQYPSMIYTYAKEQNEKAAYIELGENTHISGEIIAYNQFLKKDSWPLIKISNNTIVQGQVFCNGYVDLTGSVAGNITTLKFYHNGLSGSYENTLVNAHISLAALSPFFSGSKLIHSSKNQQSIKTLK